MDKSIDNIIGKNLSSNEGLNKNRQMICIKNFNEIVYEDLKEIFIKMLETNIAPKFILDKLDSVSDKLLIIRFKNIHDFSNDFICMNVVLKELIDESCNRTNLEIIKSLEIRNFEKTKEILQMIKEKKGA